MKTKKLFGDHNPTVVIMTLLVLAVYLLICYVYTINIFSLKLLLLVGFTLSTVYTTVWVYIFYNEREDKKNIEKFKLWEEYCEKEKKELKN